MFVGYRVQYTTPAGPPRRHPVPPAGDHQDVASWLSHGPQVRVVTSFGGQGGGRRSQQFTLQELELVTRLHPRDRDHLGRTRTSCADVYTDERTMAWILDEYERIKREHVPAW